jgi:hypothetical protein
MRDKVLTQTIKLKLDLIIKIEGRYSKKDFILKYMLGEVILIMGFEFDLGDSHG